MSSKTKSWKPIEQVSPRSPGKGEKGTPSDEEKILSWLRSSRIPSEVRERIFQFAGSTLPVFIQGEEGTGRDEVAKALHLLGPRKDAPFLRLSCHRLTPEKFIERVSPLGKGRGPSKKVSFTLYLEELENLNDDLQVLILTLIKNHRISWPGLKGFFFNLQVISSSTSSLEEAVSTMRFRADLFELLEMLTIILKPLRERREEIPQIAREILRENGFDAAFRKTFSLEAVQALQQYDWPRNLAELESLVLRSAALNEGDSLQAEDLIFRHPRRLSGLPAGHSEEKESWFDVTLPTLAHEIKNPLVAINTFAHLLPEKYDDPEFRQEFSRLVNQDVRRINELLENLLEFAQFPIPRCTPHDLNLMLLEVLKQQEKAWPRRTQHITSELGEGLPLVFFDGSQLSFALRNLLGNAFSRMNPNALLHISTQSCREEGQGGFPESVDLKIWEDDQDEFPATFQKTDASEASQDFQNLSLALLLIQKVMARNGGKMRVRHGREAGMAIWLRFPIAE